MSDSSLSNGAPSMVVLEQALRNAVRDVYRSGNLDNLTIKRIRKAVEAEFDLEDDFFKNDPAWKEESKTIIQSEVDSQADAGASVVQPSSNLSPGPPSKGKKAQPNLPKPQKPNRDLQGRKRPSIDTVGPKKRRRKETPDTEGSTSEEKDAPRKKPIDRPKKRASTEKTEPNEHQQEESSDIYRSDDEEGVSSKKPRSKSNMNTGPFIKRGNDEEANQIFGDISGISEAKETRAEASESEMSEVLDEAPKTESRKRKSDSAKASAKANGLKRSVSEDEISEIVDEAPKVKNRKRRSESGKSQGKKTGIVNRKKSSEQSTYPNADEIKRLQGWLIKCGIRKMWHRELAPYDNSKAKIGHLKRLLADAGMAGRYSVEKANQIKEERELQADLEAVQEGAKQWGKAETEENDEPSSRPKRRLARGLQELNFLNDDDGEETD